MERIVLHLIMKNTEESLFETIHHILRLRMHMFILVKSII